MITSYEVGAVLKVIDEASPALGRMSKVAKEFSDLLIKINDSLKIMSGVIVDNFGKVDEALVASLDTARALKIEIGEIAAASRAIGRISIAGPGGSGGGSGGGGGAWRRPGGGGGSFGHVGRTSVGPHGITSSHFSMPTTPVLAAGAAVGYAAWLDAKMEDAIAQIEYHTGEKDSPENNTKYRKIIQDAMSKTGSSLDSVVEATKQEVRMFKGTPGGGVDVLPEMLTAAATEARLKGTSLEESMTALIGLAHMTKEYSPEQIKKLAPAFAFLSASNPASLGGIERAASYAVPILQSGMDVDPLQTLLLGTALTRAGATNTKSGTWLRNMALAAMPGTSLMSKMAFEKHEESLKALGLVDDKNNPTWFTDGKPDLIKMLDIAGDRAASIPLTKRAGYEKQLFGTQGAGGFALLADPAVKAQIAALGAEMNSPEFKNRYGNFMEDYKNQSPLQQGRIVAADAQNALMDLGKTVLPAFTLAIQAADLQIKNWTVVFQTLYSAAQSAISGLFGVGAAGAAWRPSGALANPAATGSFHGQPMHPSGMGPQDRNYPKQSSNDQPIHIKTAIYLDGRAIGENTSMHLARASTFPTQAAYGDSYLGWNAPDNNFATG